MAISTSSERDDADTARKLLEAAPGADFYALLRLLERLRPAAARLGGEGPAHAEPARLRHDPSFGFSTSDVREVTEEGGRWGVMTTFLGLTGVVSPLPLHMAEEVLMEDPSAAPRRDFLDIFHHRLLSLLFRLIARLDWTREYLSDGRDEWSRRILALIGAGEEAEARLSRPRLLRLAALRITHAPTARTLGLALADVLAPVLAGAEVSIEQFIGDWVPIDREQRMRLGQANSRLGSQAVLGSRAFLRQAAFRVVIRPLTEANFRGFLPGGGQLALIDTVVRAFSPDTSDYKVELVLAMGHTPKYALGGDNRSRLGQDTWLSGQRNCDTHVIVEPRRRHPDGLAF